LNPFHFKGRRTLKKLSYLLNIVLAISLGITLYLYISTTQKLEQQAAGNFVSLVSSSAEILEANVSQPATVKNDFTTLMKNLNEIHISDMYTDLETTSYFEQAAHIVSFMNKKEQLSEEEIAQLEAITEGLTELDNVLTPDMNLNEINKVIEEWLPENDLMKLL